jgi:hypothetical protein
MVVRTWNIKKCEVIENYAFTSNLKQSNDNGFYWLS